MSCIMKMAFFACRHISKGGSTQVKCRDPLLCQSSSLFGRILLKNFFWKQDRKAKWGLRDTKIRRDTKSRSETYVSDFLYQNYFCVKPRWTERQTHLTEALLASKKIILKINCASGTLSELVGGSFWGPYIFTICYDFLRFLRREVPLLKGFVRLLHKKYFLYRKSKSDTSKSHLAILSCSRFFLRFLRFFTVRTYHTNIQYEHTIRTYRTNIPYEHRKPYDTVRTLVCLWYRRNTMIP